MKKLLVIASFVALAACKKENKISQDQLQTDSVTVENDSTYTAPEELQSTLKLETFGFPPEVEGCSCYFAATKADFDAEKYVYIDDYGNNAYVKIDGKLIKTEMKEGDFDPENFNKTIKNGDITITLTGKKVRELEEVMMFTGTMTVETKDGRKTSTPVYGECGC